MTQGVLPFVSVVLCTYEYAHYLPRAIDSALAQDWPADRLEVIVVDDGSTDDTPAVAAAYGDRIRYVRQENAGLNAATQRGMELARGDLWTMLDADDAWPAGRVRALAEVLLARPEVGVVYGDMAIVDEQEQVVHPSFRAREGVAPGSGRVLGRLMAHNFVSAGSMMVRAALREHFLPIGPEAAWQDWWICGHVAPLCEIAAIDDVVNLYREHDANMNLGTEGARLAGAVAQEPRYRRHLLRRVRAGWATPAELVAAVEALHGVVTHLGLLAHPGAGALLDADGGQRERAGQERAAATGRLEAGDLDGAAAGFARALGDDPRDGAALAGLRSCVTRSADVRVTGELPLVSCLVGVYDFERFLKPCLDSVWAQEYPADHLEVVVVDDGSTDGSGDIVRSYGERIRYVHKENAGVLDSTNRLVDEARGDYLTFLSGDDVWLPRRVSAHVELLRRRPELGLVYSDAEVIDDHGRTTQPSYLGQYAIAPQAGDLRGALLARNPIPGGAMTIRGSLRAQLSPIPDHSAGADWWMAARVCDVAPAAFVPGAVYAYRQHDANIFFGVTEGEKFLAILEADVVYRRWALRHHAVGELAPGPILETTGHLLAHVAQLAAGRGCPAQDLLVVTAADRAAAAEALGAAHAALTRSDVPALASHAARALGHDPFAADAHQLLAALGVPLPATPVGVAGPALDRGDMRDTVVAALADELVERPALLEAWGRAVDGGDAVTLLVLAPGWTDDRLAGELGAAVAAAGLDAGDAADLLAHAAADRNALLRAAGGAADAVLSDRPSPMQLAHLPRLTATSVGALARPERRAALSATAG